MPEIRLAVAADLETLWPMVGRAVAHMNALGNPQWGEDYPTRDHYADDLARGELYAACGGDGALLGVVCLNTQQSPEYAPLPWRSSGPALVIHRMAVDPAAQRQGVGRAFFAFAEELAREKGLGAIHADTYSLNERMQALFLRLGYAQVGQVHFGRPHRHLGYPCFEKVLTA